MRRQALTDSICFVSVATAATASSLLTPPPAAPVSGGPSTNVAEPGIGASAGAASARPTTGPRAVLEQLRNRFRPNNASRPTEDDNSIENVLRDYMRHAMNPDRDLQADIAAGSATDGDGLDDTSSATPTRNTSTRTAQPSLSTLLPNTDPASFEAFLNSMQLELIQALREFNGDVLSPGQHELLLPDVLGSALTPSEAETVPVASGSAMAEDIAEEGRTDPPNTSSADGDIEMADAAAADVAPAPVNPNLQTDPLSGSPADDATDPSRLHFFRVFQFPARERSFPNRLAGNNAPVPPAMLVPVIVVGVRSITRDIASLAQEDVDGAGLFDDNETEARQTQPTPATGTSATNPPSQTSAPRPPLSNITTPPASAAPTGERPARRSRSSFLGALRAMGIQRRSRSQDRSDDRNSVEQPAAPAVTTRNYVIWVMGGYYPPGHPILTVPRLLTGELSHDDLWALAEALGSVKPPTATKEDIAKAGLEVVKGSDIPEAVSSGKVHDMCLERCLVSVDRYITWPSLFAYYFIPRSVCQTMKKMKTAGSCNAGMHIM